MGNGGNVMKRVTFLILVLTLAVLGLNCSGGGGGGDSQDWLVGTWRMITQPVGPNSWVEVSFRADGSLSARQQDGDTDTGTWRRLSATQIQTTSSGGTATVTVQRISANQMRVPDSEGTSTWNRV